ncbi:methanogen output domain 1-containing protein [Vreelandella utahensis]|uniref:methanogen output domain 1-containing protein n=1 Tax=Vreelandella halophila TaxID=86177 RepID=UPI000984B551|nr:methanogen output domain 1-containing protein [Halomonas utahensis]
MQPNNTSPRSIPLADLDIPLERESFQADLISELSGVLEDVVGLEEASGFISIVGQNIGVRLDSDYRKALGVASLTRSQVADVLVDFKARIKGDFYIIEQDDERVVLGNRVCPFGDKVRGHSSMCMMTSNVFGAIASENLGFAKVSLEETIARGNAGCRVVIYLRESQESDTAPGQEYFRVGAGNAERS